MPNWKDPKAYPEDLDRAGWVWEFMRRNGAYRADYAKAAAAWKEVPRSGGLYTSGRAYEVDRLARGLGAKWGQLDPIANPDQDEVPRFFLSGPIEPDSEQVQTFYCEHEESGLVLQRPEFATLTFDLRRPLRPQLRRAESMLAIRRKGISVIRPARSSAREWRLYLRVLDAKEAGAKTHQIITEIKAYRILGTSAETKYAAHDRVSDHLKRARQLRDNPLSIMR
jgi:hypothetical protein